MLYLSFILRYECFGSPHCFFFLTYVFHLPAKLTIDGTDIHCAFLTIYETAGDFPQSNNPYPPFLSAQQINTPSYKLLQASRQCSPPALPWLLTETPCRSSSTLFILSSPWYSTSSSRGISSSASQASKKPLKHTARLRVPKLRGLVFRRSGLLHRWRREDAGARFDIRWSLRPIRGFRRLWVWGRWLGGRTRGLSSMRGGDGRFIDMFCAVILI